MARFFVGPTAAGLIGVFGTWLIVAVNPWLGVAVLVFSARRWEDFLPRQPQKPTETPRKASRTTSKAKRPDCQSVFLETLVILGDDPLARLLELTYGTMREHGKSAQVCAEIALRHHEDEIRDAGLNLPCFP